VTPLTLNDNTSSYRSSPDTRRGIIQQQNNRPASVASIQTMVTAPMTPRQLPTQSTSTGTINSSVSRPSSVMSNNIMRPRSTVSTSSRVLGQPFSNNAARGGKQQHMTRDGLRSTVLPHKFNEEELFDDNVNPWQHIPTGSKQHSRRDSHSSEDSIEENTSRNSRTNSRGGRLLRKTASNSHLRLPSPMYNRQQQQQQQGLSSSPSPTPLYSSQQQQLLHSMTPIHNNNLYQQSPVPGSSASSSVTATPQLLNNMLQQQHNERNVYTPTSQTTERGPLVDSRSNSRNQQYTTSVVALGPATKRALESLQNEVIALNDRIDDLRRELVERDKQRAIALSSSKRDSDEVEKEDGMGEGWKWVIKVSLGYIHFFILRNYINRAVSVGCSKVCWCEYADSVHIILYTV
jgi:hypothetical protein